MDALGVFDCPREITPFELRLRMMRAAELGHYAVTFQQLKRKIQPPQRSFRREM